MKPDRLLFKSAEAGHLEKAADLFNAPARALLNRGRVIKHLKDSDKN